MHHHINSEMLAKLNLKKGSSWVYKDSLSGEVRTFYATNYIGWASRDESDDYYETITTTIEADTSHGVMYHDYLEFQLRGNIVSMSSFYRRFTGPGSGEVQGPFTNVVGPMVVRAHTFDEVVPRLTIDSNNYFYIAGGVGIIKMKVSDSAGTAHIWELSSWNIVK